MPPVSVSTADPASTPTLPDWRSLIDASHRAQAQFPGIWPIAWDWVLTADGPMLLEGNLGWGGAVPQQLQGGWLGRHAAETLSGSADGDGRGF